MRVPVLRVGHVMEGLAVRAEQVARSADLVGNLLAGLDRTIARRRAVLPRMAGCPAFALASVYKREVSLHLPRTAFRIELQIVGRAVQRLLLVRRELGEHGAP